jgi:DNA-binding Lrp family transcriptional regulator
VNVHIDDRDRDLLRVAQDGLPLEPRPYSAIASRLGWSEEEVISRLEALLEAGYVRKVGAVLSSKRMGGVSVLAAADVPDDRVDEVASIINSYSGVTHNYLREGRPNIWFTLTERDPEALDANLSTIESAIDAPVIRMPSTKMYKIGVRLDL